MTPAMRPSFGLILANHELRQLAEHDIRSAVLANAGTRVCLRHLAQRNKSRPEARHHAEVPVRRSEVATPLPGCVVIPTCDELRFPDLLLLVINLDEADVSAVGEVDAVLLSHAHRDHAGALGLLVKLGSPPVYATETVARVAKRDRDKSASPTRHN